MYMNNEYMNIWNVKWNSQKVQLSGSKVYFYEAKIIHREILFKKKISNPKTYLQNILSEFQCENAESLPDLFQMSLNVRPLYTHFWQE